jgi:hypothetical protein
MAAAASDIAMYGVTVRNGTRPRAAAEARRAVLRAGAFFARVAFFFGIAINLHV